MKYNLTKTILIGLILSSFSSISFAWPVVNGIAICTAANNQDNPQIVSDGSGGTIISWEDERNGYGIYAQRVNSSGSTLWILNGVAICTATTSQEFPRMVSDGAGGTIIAWLDLQNETENYANFNIYAQRVNSSGSTLWTLNGVSIGSAANVNTFLLQYFPSIVSDGSGGAIITWWDADIYAQRVDSMGNTLWTTNGVAICTVDQLFQTIVSDGAGGAIITWNDDRDETGWHIYAQRVDSMGNTLWTTNGVAICTAANGQGNPQIVSDGSGGAIIIWGDDRNGWGYPNIYAQRVDSTGSTLWTLNGVAICTGAYSQENPTLVSNGSGGAIITWQDYRNASTYNIYAQRVDFTGSTLWIVNGVAICTAVNWQESPTLVSDGSGGAIITWQDDRNDTTSNFGNWDIYTQRVNSMGSTLWTLNGVAICTGAYSQENPTLVSNGSGGAIVTWQDLRNGIDWDIYAQSVDSSGIAGPIPPFFSTLPALKLFSNQSINNALFLEDYNTSGVATGYSILNDFEGLATLTGSTESQGAYGSPTVGTNTFIASNAVGTSTADSQVKYSTYKIYKLPEIGLTVGSSWDVNVGNYTYDTSGLALSPSFGNQDSLNVSDLSSVTAYWVNDSVVRITSLQSFSGAVDIDVTASPNAVAPFGSDVDVERIQVYSNLLANNTFSTSNDTSIWMPLEIPPGRSTLASQQWISSYTDAAGTKANGVWQFTFADASSGVKSTPALSDWINITNGQWYTFRIRLVADTPNNNHLALLFGFTNYPSSGTQTDIVGNVLFGVPTVWTWQEAPLLAHGSSALGYPQFQFKAGGAGSIYVDEIQILNATPELMQARSNTHLHYLYGQFTTGNDTTGWGQELYPGSVSAPPGISVNNGLVLDFTGAGVGTTAQEGIKWTANNGVQGPGHAYTFPVNVNRQAGVQLTLSMENGNFNTTLGIVLVAAYGAQTAGQQGIGKIIAAAGVGTLVSGNYYAIGEALYPYVQGQFGVRSDAPGILEVSNVDVNVDNDDPNFGDGSLFP